MGDRFERGLSTGLSIGIRYVHQCVCRGWQNVADVGVNCAEMRVLGFARAKYQGAQDRYNTEWNTGALRIFRFFENASSQSKAIYRDGAIVRVGRTGLNRTQRMPPALERREGKRQASVQLLTR